MFDYTPLHAAQALGVVEKLQAAGFTAYFAGGCVRDALLGRKPKDFDVATDAVPDKVRDVFGKRRTLAFGASFGVIGVLGDADTPTEVATFRSDGDYSDGRRPDSVRFGTAEFDALRRDFTINGVFYDPKASRLIDFVGGENDLRRSIIRAIGDPDKRINEDKLRMLRAVRFASSLGFTIEPNTFDATKRFAADVSIVSGERIGAEMRRMLSSPGSSIAIQLLFETGLLSHVWPTFALQICRNEKQLIDAKLLLGAIDPPSFVVATACVLANADTDVQHSLAELVRIWKLSCDEKRVIDASVEHRETILNASNRPWSVVQPILASRDARAIVSVAKAWGQAFNEQESGTKLCEERLGWSPEQLDPSPLVTGDTLNELGFKPGPQFRDVLQSLRNDQLDQKIATKEAAIQRAVWLLKQP